MTAQEYTSSEAFANLTIGVNPVELNRLFKEWQKTASPDELLSARDSGVHHWPSLASSMGGVLKITAETHSKKEDRTYAVAPFPVTSVPKPLRPAFTSPIPGHVLIDLDWKASHWQILAFRSGDQNLISDLKGSDLYTTMFPEVDRKLAKVGLNTALNGGGVRALMSSFPSEESAKFLLDKAHNLLDTRWQIAGSYLKNLKQTTFEAGFVDAPYAGGGVGLMRIEAEALRSVCTQPRLLAEGVKVILPMHDGVLLSAPADKADKVAKMASMLMAFFSTGSKEEANDYQMWVTSKVSKSWNGDVNQLLGRDLRSSALSVLATSDLDKLWLPAAVLPPDTISAAKAHHRNSKEGKAFAIALSERESAQGWLTSSFRKHEDVPPVDLPHLIPSYSNLCRILSEDKALPRLSYDLRASTVHIGGEVMNDTLLRTSYLPALESRYGMARVSEEMLVAASLDTAKKNGFDPVLDYFDSLPAWDGQLRAGSWLQDFAGCESLDGLGHVYSRKWLLSVIARAYRPGCKVDTVLVLYGGQGAGKSTILRAISPASSFAEMSVDPTDKDMVLKASRYAVVEWAELAGHSRRETETLKSYFTNDVDEVRPAYARGPVRIPRRTVFSATTNRDDFLTDETGARRFWPVKVQGNLNIKGLLEVKDQLWAEALLLYKASEGSNYRWWLSPDEEVIKVSEDSNYTPEDPIAETVMAYAIQEGGSFTLEGLLSHLDVRPSDRSKMIKTVSTTLVRLGFKNVQIYNNNGSRSRCWQGAVPSRSKLIELDNIIPFSSKS
jgi:hypothetical protein